jgi:hypothetical protein
VAREPIRIQLPLTEGEAAELIQPSGEGGHQRFHELQEDGMTISLTDEQLGRIVRYIGAYGGGGFQGRLRRAFRRALVDYIA